MHKRSTLDIPLFHHTFALYKLIDQYTEIIPKAKRYAIWQQIQQSTLLILKGIVEAGHYKGVEQHKLLLQMSVQIDLLKVFTRLCKETRCLDLKRYIELERRLQELGKMLGGWIKFAGPEEKL